MAGEASDRASEAKLAPPDSCLIPLLIGVTGDVSPNGNEEELRKALTPGIRAIFRKVRGATGFAAVRDEKSANDSQAKDPVVWLLCSRVGTAEELVAEIAEQEVDARIVHIWPSELPKPSEPTWEDRVDREVPLATADPTLCDELVARYSQLVIALWDGETASSPAADVVGKRREGRYSPDLANLLGLTTSPLDRYRTGITYRVWRASSANDVGVEEIFPEGYTETSEREAYLTRHRGILSKISKFNANARRILPALHEEARVEESRDRVLPPAEEKDLPSEIRTILCGYGLADTMALHFQSRMKWALRGLCWLAGLSVLFFGVYSHLAKDHATWGLGIYLGILGAAGVLFFIADSRDLQSNYLDYRAIAEGLRVQLFWRISGIAAHASAHYLRRQRSELDWIRDAIDAWSIGTSPLTKPREDLAINHWVDDQSGFFRDRIPKKVLAQVEGRLFAGMALLCSLGLAVYVVMFHAAPLWVPILGALSLVVGIALLVKSLCSLCPKIGDHCSLKTEAGRRRSVRIAAAVGLGILVNGGIAWVIIDAESWIPDSWHAYLKTHEHDVFVVAMGVTAVIAGLTHWYMEKMAFGDEASQYERMASILQDASSQLGAKGSNHDILLDLGKEALAENGDWVLAHREKPIEIPPPGA